MTDRTEPAGASTRPSGDRVSPSGQDGPGGAGQDGPGGERQIPFFCPYCGEEDLYPAGQQAGSWACRSCARGFTLRFAGVSRAEGVG